MEELFQRFWSDLTSRPSGPFAFRFVLQPAMAMFFAVRAGLRDARFHKPVFLWSVFTRRDLRRDLLRDGWKDVSRVFLLAVVLDVVFQIVELGAIRPLETLVIGFTLALLPYAVVRGPVNRIARRLHRDSEMETLDERPRKAA